VAYFVDGRFGPLEGEELVPDQLYNGLVVVSTKFMLFAHASNDNILPK
jgi:hypothetical protein